MDIVRTVSKLIAPLQRRVMLTVGRCVIKAVNDSQTMQLLKVGIMQGETRDKVEHVQQYGFTSVPHVGAEAVAVFVQGNRDHGLIIATDDRRYRLKSLANGEVAIYTDEGDRVHLKRGGQIEIKASTKVRVETPILECTGDIIDNVDTNVTTVKQMRTIYDSHTHTGDSGANTSNPHQVMS